MIWGEHPFICLFSLMSQLAHSLGKTIQMIARILDGRPRKSDKEAGWDAQTLSAIFAYI